MKNLTKLLFLLLIGIAPYTLAAQCNYVLVMQDSWGDGWNGGFIDVSVAGVVTTYTFDATVGTPLGDEWIVPIAVNPADVITLTVTNGQYPTEQAYELRDATGTVVHSDGSVPCIGCSMDDALNPPATGLVYTGAAACPACMQPAATATVVPDCANSQFTVNVAVTSLGDATSLALNSDLNGLEATITATGTTTLGPYPSGTSLVYTFVHNVDTQCNLTLPTTAFTCPPVNDDCSSPTTLVDGVAVSSTNVAGTVSPAEFDGTTGILAVCNPPAGFSIENAVWFTFTIATASTYEFEMVATCALSMAIYETSNVSCTAIANSNLTVGECAAFAGGGDAASFALTPGTYYAIVDGSGGQECPFSLKYSQFVPQTVCSVSDLAAPGTTAVCPGGSFDVATLGVDTIPNSPTQGGLGWVFSDASGGTGALGGTFILTGVSSMETYDEDLNGVLSGNNFPVFSGTWVVYSAIYSDPSDTFGSICSVSSDSLIVNFLTAAPSAGTMAGGGNACYDATLTATVGTPATVPAGTDQYYALTQGSGLTIVALSTTPTFDLSTIDFTTLGVPDCGLFTIHSAVVDAGFDVTTIVPGTTTGLDIVGLISAGTLCGALDAPGASFNVACTPVAITATSTPEACGGLDGTATASGAVTYVWNTGATGATLMGVAAGTYSVVGTDAGGCTGSASVTVGSAGGPNATATSANVTCAGDADGSVTITVSGGATPYTYAWSNGAITQNLMGVAGGSYSCTVSDASGCAFVVAPVTITEPATLGYTIDVAVIQLPCAGSNAGAIGITTTGGTAPYTYLWSNGATSEDVSGLTAGTYSGTITDANGCTLASPSIPVTEPMALGYNIDAAVIQLACKGDATGLIAITTTGGTAPYTYAWSNGATSEDVSGLTAGTYSGTITDANGCMLASPSIPVTEPAMALVLTLDGVVDENGGDGSGAVNITVTGGEAPYTYAWSNGEMTEDIAGLSMDDYFVTLTDDNGCEIIGGPYSVGDFVNTEDIEGLNSLTVQPNPTSDMVFIQLGLDKAMDVEMDIYSVSGQRLASYADGNIVEKQYELNLGNYPTGVYFAKFTINNQVITRRIVVLK